ncbi:hypothetical protein PAEPH01_1966 [Pancytospora epiphaga]|nr:hypothetical protein PAEPH01_1966 [Pancytospora epiphaga]
MQSRKCNIKTTKGKRACILGQRRISRNWLDKTKDAVEKLKRAGIVFELNSTWRNPMRLVEKPDRSIRICTNLIALNNLVEKNKYFT